MRSDKTSFALAASLAAVLLCWSCEMGALGARLDLEAPRLTLTLPAFAETVLEKFEVAGTVTDNVKTTLLTVHIEGLSREWRNNLGIWQIRETPEAPWQTCPGVWNPGGATVSWSLPVSLAGIPGGEYMITVNSFDKFGNNDAKSLQQVKITYSSETPFFTVLNPVLKTGNANRVPRALEDMDDNTRLNPAFIRELYNESVSFHFEISGGDFSQNGSLNLRLAGPPSGSDLDSADLIPGDIWYEKTIPLSGRTGSVTILHDEIQHPVSGPASGRTPLRLISRITDSQGREEYKSSGWFMWWPESDKPWVLFPAGSDPAADPYTKLYEGGENTAYAYDDDGVASLTYRIYKWDRKEGRIAEKPVLEKRIPFGENQSEWPFSIPRVPDDYCIEADVTDIKGIRETGRAWITATKRPSLQYKYLTRISSSNTDGTYLAGSSLNIRLDFDVPIIVNGTPKIRLNLKNKSSLDRYADYSSGSQSKTLYFTYTIQDGDFTPQTNPLDVTGFDTSAGHFSFHDPYEIVNIDNEVKVPSDPEARLGGQKNIYVVSGKARVSSATLDKRGRLTVEFAWPENPFSWSLVRGSGDLKLAVRESDYRVPSVITETRYRRLGLEDNNPYYERTINGAFSSGITDTNPKYVLRFDLDTATFGISGNSSSTNEMKNLRHDIRTRETITLSAFASQISLSSHTMTVNLGELLPVRGVRYGLNVDSGFLKDSLAGIDLDAMAEEMVYPGVEKPFFRVEKKDEEYDSGKRQAKQPAVARVKLDSRTPDAEIQYTDPGHPDSYTSDYAENHLLEQVAVDGRWHLAPQPRPEDINAVGNKASLPEPRANKLPALHEPRKNDSRTKKYTGEFTIGNENYAMGGMVYRLAAVAYSKAEPDTPSDPSYEVAYRSVLVFNNTEVEKISSDIGQTVRLDGYNGDSNPSIFSFPGPYRDGRNLRIWLMGGDSVSGFVVTPGFPLAWDANKYHGIRLMTPIGSTGTSGGDYDKYTRIGSHTNNNDVTLETNLTYERDVPSSYNTKGTYTWYWITWKLGNAAYVQFQRRAINDSRGSNDPLFDTRYISDLKQGWNDYKEYYPVFPGETRVVNPVTPYWYRDGQIYQYYKILNKRDSSTRWHPIKG